MPDHRALSTHRFMVDRLNQWGTPQRALRSLFLRGLWRTSTAEDRAVLLTRIAWCARNRKLATGEEPAPAAAFARSLQEAARNAGATGPFEVATSDLHQDSLVELEAALLLLHSLPEKYRMAVRNTPVPAVEAES
ncbi:hypothetical protein ABZ820_12320 [Streptomyces diacarni]|uniref:hypothetical protein n=1 Tax=Streptomyces diacarni TaxID=2800381 RepID=UPI0033C870AA